MQATGIDLRPLDHSHLESALVLSRQARWPHRLEEWQMLLELSRGLVAVENEEVVATIFVTPYGDHVATINMVIVDETMRGRGIGRRIMQAALDMVGERECRLVATAEGCLFMKVSASRKSARSFSTRAWCVRQHRRRSNGQRLPISNRSSPSTAPLWGRIARALVEALFQAGRLAVQRKASALRGYAALAVVRLWRTLRPGRCRNHRRRRGPFALFYLQPGLVHSCALIPGVRPALPPFLLEHGLAHVGGGITTAPRTF